MLVNFQAQVAQIVIKVLFFLVAAALYLMVRLVLPVIRSAVVALVRFPAVVADRHSESQHAEIEWLLAEADRLGKANTKAPDRIDQIVAVTTPTPASGSDSDEPERVDNGEVEQAPVLTPATVTDAETTAEPAPEPVPQDTAEVDEGPVLRYRPSAPPSD